MLPKIHRSGAEWEILKHVQADFFSGQGADSPISDTRKPIAPSLSLGLYLRLDRAGLP